MTIYRRIEVIEEQGWAVVRLLDKKLIDLAVVHELSQELFNLVDAEHRKKIILDFESIEFLSHVVLNKLMALDKKAKSAQAELKFCCMKAEIYEVFAITRLNQLFDIKRTKQEAMAA
jgi:anti-sigma B factor antagonist